MYNTLIICATILIVVLIIEFKGLPVITVHHTNNTDYCYKDITDDTNYDTAQPIGFKEETVEEKVPTDKDKREQMLSDMASTITALFRGEVDIDEL